MHEGDLITVAVCSVNQDLRNSLLENIKATIGVPFEFLFHDNKLSQKGICSVYNDLAEKCQGNYICFIHEDVHIDTKNWGEILIKQAKNEHIGVIGFAGSKLFLGLPYWYHKDNLVFNFIQRTKDGSLHADYTSKDLNTCNDFERVTVLDGMFLFCRKSVWDVNHFDEALFKKFHMYDVDFSFMSSIKFQNFVCNNVILTHYSLGSLNQHYFDELLIGYDKWKIYFDDKINIPKTDSLKLIHQIVNDLLYRYNLSFRYIYQFLNKIASLNINHSINYCYFLKCFVRVKLGMFYKKLLASSSYEE